jgi:GMP synthase-like glutamine amidotransferase
MLIVVLDCESHFFNDLCAMVSVPDVEIVHRAVPARKTIDSTAMKADCPLLEQGDLESLKPSGILISGSPHYIYTAKGHIPPAGFIEYILQHKIPTLGVCGGHELLFQLIAEFEYNHNSLKFNQKTPRVVGVNPSRHYEPLSTVNNPIEFQRYVGMPRVQELGWIFNGLSSSFLVWMYHIHQVLSLPACSFAIGGTSITKNGAIVYSNPEDERQGLLPYIIGLQFHPEVSPVPVKTRIAENFLTRCGLDKSLYSP